MTSKTVVSLYLAAALALLPRPAAAQQKVEARRSASADALVEIENPAGSITVEGVNGTVSAETVNGSITVSGQAREIAAESVNGAVQVSGASTHTKAESVNGSVVVRGASGDLDASTVNGRLEVSGGAFERAHLETVSGSLAFDGALASGASLEAETVSGSVTLALPANVAADFSISTFSGSVENAFGPPATRVGEHTPEKELEFSSGGGGASVSVHTLSGSITLRKK